MTLDQAMDELPLVAIIRGVTPGEAVAIGEALYAEGVRIIEVPLNSPDPLHSIEALAETFAGRAIVGGGTLLTTRDVEHVYGAGGQIAVSPNTDPDVIACARQVGMDPMPGFGSCSEAFAALKAGARYLKLFPAVTYGVAHLKQLKAVLPPKAVIAPVGGVGPQHIADWWAAGARAFGIGGEIYRPGESPQQVSAKARALVSALREARGR
jgi:2-dehydro-3-deoxyphosphogalactonate aldolase